MLKQILCSPNTADDNLFLLRVKTAFYAVNVPTSFRPHCVKSNLCPR